MDGALLLDGAAVTMTKLLYSDQSSICIAGLFFVIYMCCTALMIMQMLIGVLTQVIADVTANEKMKDEMLLIEEQLLEKIKEIDTDGTLLVTRSELVTLLETPESISLI